MANNFAGLVKSLLNIVQEEYLNHKERHTSTSIMTPITKRAHLVKLLQRDDKNTLKDAGEPGIVRALNFERIVLELMEIEDRDQSIERSDAPKEGDANALANINTLPADKKIKLLMNLTVLLQVGANQPISSSLCKSIEASLKEFSPVDLTLNDRFKAYLGDEEKDQSMKVVSFLLAQVVVGERVQSSDDIFAETEKLANAVFQMQKHFWSAEFLGDIAHFSELEYRDEYHQKELTESDWREFVDQFVQNYTRELDTNLLPEDLANVLKMIVPYLQSGQSLPAMMEGALRTKPTAREKVNDAALYDAITGEVPTEESVPVAPAALDGDPKILLQSVTTPYSDQLQRASQTSDYLKEVAGKVEVLERATRLREQVIISNNTFKAAAVPAPDNKVGLEKAMKLDFALASYLDLLTSDLARGLTRDNKQNGFAYKLVNEEDLKDLDRFYASAISFRKDFAAFVKEYQGKELLTTQDREAHRFAEATLKFKYDQLTADLPSIEAKIAERLEDMGPALDSLNALSKAFLEANPSDAPFDDAASKDNFLGGVDNAFRKAWLAASDELKKQEDADNPYSLVESSAGDSRKMALVRLHARMVSLGFDREAARLKESMSFENGAVNAYKNKDFVGLEDEMQLRFANLPALKAHLVATITKEVEAIRDKDSHTGWPNFNASTILTLLNDSDGFFNNDDIQGLMRQSVAEARDQANYASNANAQKVLVAIAKNAQELFLVKLLQHFMSVAMDQFVITPKADSYTAETSEVASAITAAQTAYLAIPRNNDLMGFDPTLAANEAKTALAEKELKSATTRACQVSVFVEDDGDTDYKKQIVSIRPPQTQHVMTDQRKDPLVLMDVDGTEAFRLSARDNIALSTAYVLHKLLLHYSTMLKRRRALQVLDGASPSVELVGELPEDMPLDVWDVMHTQEGALLFNRQALLKKAYLNAYEVYELAATHELGDLADGSYTQPAYTPPTDLDTKKLKEQEDKAEEAKAALEAARVAFGVQVQGAAGSGGAGGSNEDKHKTAFDSEQFAKTELFKLLKRRLAQQGELTKEMTEWNEQLAAYNLAHADGAPVKKAPAGSLTSMVDIDQGELTNLGEEAKTHATTDVTEKNTESKNKRLAQFKTVFEGDARKLAVVEVPSEPSSSTTPASASALARMQAALEFDLVALIKDEKKSADDAKNAKALSARVALLSNALVQANRLLGSGDDGDATALADLTKELETLRAELVALHKQYGERLLGHITELSKELISVKKEVAALGEQVDALEDPDGSTDVKQKLAEKKDRQAKIETLLKAIATKDHKVDTKRTLGHLIEMTKLFEEQQSSDIKQGLANNYDTDVGVVNGLYDNVKVMSLSGTVDKTKSSSAGAVSQESWDIKIAKAVEASRQLASSSASGLDAVLGFGGLTAKNGNYSYPALERLVHLLREMRVYAGSLLDLQALPFIETQPELAQQVSVEDAEKRAQELRNQQVKQLAADLKVLRRKGDGDKKADGPYQNVETKDEGDVLESAVATPETPFDILGVHDNAKEISLNHFNRVFALYEMARKLGVDGNLFPSVEGRSCQDVWLSAFETEGCTAMAVSQSSEAESKTIPFAVLRERLALLGKVALESTLLAQMKVDQETFENNLQAFIVTGKFNDLDPRDVITSAYGDSRLQDALKRKPADQTKKVLSSSKDAFLRLDGGQLAGHFARFYVLTDGDGAADQLKGFTGADDFVTAIVRVNLLKELGLLSTLNALENVDPDLFEHMKGQNADDFDLTIAFLQQLKSIDITLESGFLKASFDTMLEPYLAAQEALRDAMSKVASASSDLADWQRMLGDASRKEYLAKFEAQEQVIASLREVKSLNSSGSEDPENGEYIVLDAAKAALAELTKRDPVRQYFAARMTDVPADAKATDEYIRTQAQRLADELAQAKQAVVTASTSAERLKDPVFFLAELKRFGVTLGYYQEQLAALEKTVAEAEAENDKHELAVSSREVERDPAIKQALTTATQGVTGFGSPVKHLLELLDTYGGDAREQCIERLDQLAKAGVTLKVVTLEYLLELVGLSTGFDAEIDRLNQLHKFRESVGDKSYSEEAWKRDVVKVSQNEDHKSRLATKPSSRKEPTDAEREALMQSDLMKNHERRAAASRASASQSSAAPAKKAVKIDGTELKKRLDSYQAVVAKLAVNDEVSRLERELETAQAAYDRAAGVAPSVGGAGATASAPSPGVTPKVPASDGIRAAELALEKAKLDLATFESTVAALSQRYMQEAGPEVRDLTGQLLALPDENQRNALLFQNSLTLTQQLEVVLFNEIAGMTWVEFTKLVDKARLLVKEGELEDLGVDVSTDKKLVAELSKDSALRALVDARYRCFEAQLHADVKEYSVVGAHVASKLRAALTDSGSTDISELRGYIAEAKDAQLVWIGCSLDIYGRDLSESEITAIRALLRGSAAGLSEDQISNLLIGKKIEISQGGNYDLANFLGVYNTSGDRASLSGAADAIATLDPAQLRFEDPLGDVKPVLTRSATELERDAVITVLKERAHLDDAQVSALLRGGVIPVSTPSGPEERDLAGYYGTAAFEHALLVKAAENDRLRAAITEFKQFSPANVGLLLDVGSFTPVNAAGLDGDLVTLEDVKKDVNAQLAKQLHVRYADIMKAGVDASEGKEEAGDFDTDASEDPKALLTAYLGLEDDGCDALIAGVKVDFKEARTGRVESLDLLAALRKVEQRIEDEKAFQAQCKLTNYHLYLLHTDGESINLGGETVSSLGDLVRLRDEDRLDSLVTEATHESDVSTMHGNAALPATPQQAQPAPGSVSGSSLPSSAHGSRRSRAVPSAAPSPARTATASPRRQAP